jgi:hypothetical protein
VDEAELLERIATLVRQDIAPAVEADYPRTQAFMSAVVLQKLARQLSLREVHRAADASDVARLAADLALAAEAVPEAVAHGLAALSTQPAPAALCTLVAALYAARDELGDERFTAMLGRVRQTLRAQIDRRLEYAA